MEQEVTATPVAAAPPPKVEFDNNGLPIPLEWETKMGRGEAAKSRKPELRAQQCLIFNAFTGWWDVFGGKWLHRDYRPIGTMSVEKAVGMFGNDSDLYIDNRPEDPANPRRKCDITQIVSADVIKLITLSPNNATFRAKLMACPHIGEMPPKEADTFEKIRTWVETTFPKTTAATAAPVKKRAVNIEYSAYEVQHGSCAFTRTARYRSNVNIDENTIRGMVGDADDFDHLMAMLYEHMQEHVQNTTPIRFDDLQTHSHTVDDNDGISVDYADTNLRRLALEIAKEVVPAEDHDGFGLE